MQTTTPEQTTPPLAPAHCKRHFGRVTYVEPQYLRHTGELVIQAQRAHIDQEFHVPQRTAEISVSVESGAMSAYLPALPPQAARELAARLIEAAEFAEGTSP